MSRRKKFVSIGDYREYRDSATRGHDVGDSFHDNAKSAVTVPTCPECGAPIFAGEGPPTPLLCPDCRASADKVDYVALAMQRGQSLDDLTNELVEVEGITEQAAVRLVNAAVANHIRSKSETPDAVLPVAGMARRERNPWARPVARPVEWNVDYVAIAIERGQSLIDLTNDTVRVEGVTEEAAVRLVNRGILRWKKQNYSRYLMDFALAAVCVAGGVVLLAWISEQAQNAANESGHSVTWRVPFGLAPFFFAFYLLRRVYKRLRRQFAISRYWGKVMAAMEGTDSRP